MSELFEIAAKGSKAYADLLARADRAETERDNWMKTAQEIATERDALRARVEELEAGIQHLAEYWNHSENTKAMTDACWHTVSECGRLMKDSPSQALAIREAKERVISAAKEFITAWYEQITVDKLKTASLLGDAVDDLDELEKSHNDSKIEPDGDLRN